MDGPGRKKAGVPEEVPFQSKPEIAGALIAEALVDGVTAAPILGDSVYGNAGALRSQIRGWGWEYFFNAEERWLGGISRPKLRRGPRYWTVAKTAPAGQQLRPMAEDFKPAEWHTAAWHAAQGEKRTTRLAWKQIFLHGDLNAQTGEWPPCWLVADWPQGQTDPYHLYVAWLRQPPSQGRMLRLGRGRWPIEQYFQRGKDDWGLDHFEGRSWRGFHHHLTMSAIAYLFVVVDSLRTKNNFRPDVGSGVTRDATIHRAFTPLLSLSSNTI